MIGIGKKSGNFQQVFWLMLSQFSSYLSIFLSTAVLSRYLPRQEYGTYSQILYIYTMLMSVFTVGLPSVFSYFIPKIDNGQQKYFINSVNKLLFISGFLFSLLLYLSSDLISDLLKNPALSIGLKIFSPFPLFTLPTIGIEGIYTALRDTKTVALYQSFSRVILMVCIVTPVVFYNTSYEGAIVGWGVASVITFFLSMYLKNRPYKEVETKKIHNVFKNIFEYSLPLMGASLAGLGITAADQFFISRYYGEIEFAKYTNGSLSIPIILIVAVSIKKVLIPLFSKAETEGTISEAMNSYTSIVNKSIVFSFPIIIFSIIFSEEIVTIVYGINYVESAKYMRYYLIRDFLQVIPYLAIFLAFGMSRIYFYMHVIGVFFVWITGWIVVELKMDPVLIVLNRSIFYVGCTIFAVIFLAKNKGLKLLTKDMMYKIFIVFLQSLFFAIIVFYISHFDMFKEFNLVLLLVSSVILFYALLLSTSKIFNVNHLESFNYIIKRK